MDPVTRNFWLGAASFVGLGLLIGVVVSALTWGNRYLRWEHVHPHTHAAHDHPHEHKPHQHPHEWPEHGHPHVHTVEEAR